MAMGAIRILNVNPVAGKVFEIQDLSNRSELTDQPAWVIALANKPSAFSAAPLV